MDKRSIFTAILIFSLALVLRIYFIGFYSVPLIKDSLDYDSLAVSLISGNGYANPTGNPTAMRPPGYPLFLALLYSIFGHDYFFVRITQAILDSFLCVLICYFGRNLFSKKVGFLSGIIAALHLGFIAQSEKILTEGLVTILLLVAMIFLYQAMRSPRNNIHYILTGLMLGVSSLVRANFLILFFISLFGIAYRLLKNGFHAKEVCKYTAMYIAGFLTVISPWTIRNYKVFNAFVPISTMQGTAFYSSYKPKDGKIFGFVTEDEIMNKAKSLASETKKSDFLSSETVRLLLKNPWLFFKLIPLKMMYLFSPLDWEMIYNRAVFNYAYAFFLPFCIFGSLILSKKLIAFMPLYLPIVSIMLTSVIYYGSPRFRIPVEPYMIIFSSAAICNLYDKIRYKRLFTLSMSLIFLSSVAMFANSDFLKESTRALLKQIGMW